MREPGILNISMYIFVRYNNVGMLGKLVKCNIFVNSIATSSE
jgi:hypothetical protein